MGELEKKNVYEKLVTEIKRRIESGVLCYGDKLPSVRVYAVERKVNPNTVAKAYAALESEGYIRMQPKKGGYVCFGEELPKEKTGLEKELLRLRTSGVTKAEMLQAVENVYENVYEGEEV